ncbi:MAG: hypothetical protein ACKVUT_16265 [Gaiella sp.]
MSVFTGRELPTPEGSAAEEWVSVPGELRPLATSELVGWLDEELWAIELTPSRERGRLLRRHDRWSETAARAFAEACVWRARDQAVRALERGGHARPAGELSAIDDLGAVERWAVRCDVDTFPAHAAFAADVASLASGRRPDSWRLADPGRGSGQPAAVIAANLGFVVAHGAGLEQADLAGPPAYERGVRSERAWQTAWLERELDLRTDTRDV